MVPGNGHEFAESWFDNEYGEETRSISPAIRIWNQAGKTHIEVSEYAPGPGPSDFKEIRRKSCRKNHSLLFRPK